jgi:two-component system phosphate regulon sensor histidine kinase PhoR
MKNASYKKVMYFIAGTIVLTIVMQLYWNIREYQINKQNLISKVQLSLDNSVEAYFANLTRMGIITYTSLDSLNWKEKTDTIVVKTSSRRNFRKIIDSTLYNISKQENDRPLLIKNENSGNYPFYATNPAVLKNIDSLISKVFISFSRDTLDLIQLDSYLKEEFERKKIDVTYGLKYHYRHYLPNDSVAQKTINYQLDNFPKKHLTTTSKSTFLPHRSELHLLFTNETALLLRTSIISILLSLLLSASIIASILFLLKTIFKQKQLAEVKNDLINNITHEFKTPIATIATALEAMQRFNALNDKEKSEKYISMASAQVEKLNVMVEKILETAKLNQNDLQLDKDWFNCAELIENVIQRFSLLSNGKTINFNNNAVNCQLFVDKFHFENALANVLDNAIKYGGNSITIELHTDDKKIIITVFDNGNGIEKSQKDKVFEQFYRIPTGNTHNVKGFGIGLFYTKNIIEKHGGSITITYNNQNFTVFKIELPYE